MINLMIVRLLVASWAKWLALAVTILVSSVIGTIEGLIGMGMHW